jgi:hypothetical protein
MIDREYAFVYEYVPGHLTGAGKMEYTMYKPSSLGVDARDNNSIYKFYWEKYFTVINSSTLMASFESRKKK